jgi:putative ABC transport system ATP-binding protein
MIKVENAYFRWNKNGPLILHIPKFRIRCGEQIFIKGPSGSGKTTLLNLLGGVSIPETGMISIMNTNMSTLGSAGRDAFRAEHIGYIFQMFNLIPYLTLIENVTLPCRFSVARRQRVLSQAKTLEEEAKRILSGLGLDITTLASQSVSQLSIGQQQRVAAARSIIGSPELVIADEPTSSLDRDVRSSFLDLLFREVRNAKTTLIFVSHDSSLESHFDRTVSLNELNQVRQQGSQ